MLFCYCEYTASIHSPVIVLRFTISDIKFIKMIFLGDNKFVYIHK
jgi:hypothetical protein